METVPARLRAGQYTEARAKAWCLLIHAEASRSLSAINASNIKVSELGRKLGRSVPCNM